MTYFSKRLLVALSISVLGACSDGGGGGGTDDDNETPEGETEDGMDGGGRRDSGLDASKPPVKLPDGAVIDDKSDAGTDGGSFTAPDASLDIDAAVPDAGRPDAGKPDAGKVDAGKPDAAAPDASKPDTSVPDAAAPVVDAGGEPVTDAGNEPEPEPEPDAGPVDPYADCTDDKPLGCFTAQSDNPASCPDEAPIGNAECTVDLSGGAPAICAYDAPNGDPDDVANAVCLPLLGWNYL